MNRTGLSGAIRALVITAIVPLAIFVPQASVSAGQPIDPLTLNPPAFPPYTCMGTGGGAICEKDIPAAPYGPSDNQIFCGTGANAFDTFDSGVEGEKVTRYYDGNDLVRRVTVFDDDGQWSNAVTGVSAPYEQHQIITDVLGVPGDLSTITETTTGVNRFVLPHDGLLAFDNGRLTTNPNGDITFESTPHDIEAYFAGNTSALQKLCVALGAP
jgi:hypothetical protein